VVAGAVVGGGGGGGGGGHALAPRSVAFAAARSAVAASRGGCRRMRDHGTVVSLVKLEVRRGAVACRFREVAAVPRGARRGRERRGSRPLFDGLASACLLSFVLARFFRQALHLGPCKKWSLTGKAVIWCLSGLAFNN